MGFFSSKKPLTATLAAPDMVRRDKTAPRMEEMAVGTEQDEAQYPPARIVVPIMLSLLAAFFLTTLDRTIIGVAIPAISNDFHSFDDISWYESAFLLAACIAQLPTGKVYKYFSAKWTTIAVVITFEAGTIICASARSSQAFIVGRAITGMAASGSFVGVQVIMRDLIPLRKRPAYQGSLGACFGLSSIIGPIVGGAFTSNLSWRWCFWFQVPVGGIAIAGLLFLLPVSRPTDKLEGTFLEKINKFDPVGIFLVTPGLICLLLALQWGGVTYAWNSSMVIALLVMGAVLLVAFALWQWWLGEASLVPPRVIRQQSVAASQFVSVGISSALIICSFYLPIWFQAIKGLSAGATGVRLLPYFLSTVIFVIVSGVAISKLGYYTPFLLAGSAVLIVACALLTRLRVDTDNGEWIAYLIIFGFGLGLCIIQPINVIQTVLPKDDIAVGTTLMGFTQNLGGTIFVSVSQSILATSLRSNLAVTLPGFDSSVISKSGATDIRNLVTAQQLPVVLLAYNAAINNLFYCAMGLAAVALIASCFVEWKSVKVDGEMKDAAPI